MRVAVLLAAGAFVTACGASFSDPLASGGPATGAPTDAMEPLRTADGQVIGADGVPPEEKLATSPKVQAGPTPTLLPAAPPPGKEAPSATPSCSDPALDAATRKARCGAAQPSKPPR